MSDQDPSTIASKTNQGRPQAGSPGILRAAALIALIVGAVGSLGFMLRAGQLTPRLLLIPFTIWILSPFVILLWANMISKRWSHITRVTLYCVTLVVTLGSLAIYGEWIDLRPAGSANAFPFVIVPPASLIFIAIVVPMAAFISGRLSQRSNGK